MKAADLIKKSKFFEIKEFNFSNLIPLKKIVETEPTEYRKMKLADGLRLCGHFSEAQKVHNSIDKKLIPADSIAYYYTHLGRLFMDMGKFREAKKYFYRSIKLGNTTTVPHIFLANILFQEEKTSESIMILEDGLRKEGDIDEVYCNLATRFAMQNDFDKALKAINKCIRLDPDFPNALNIKKDILTCLRLKKKKQ